jgi:hypothetical protein
MAFNLFNKVYLAPDYLYDNAYNRIIFSYTRNQAEYLNYESFDFPGLNASVFYSGETVKDIIGENQDQYKSIAHYLYQLHDSGFEGRIYADEESWILIFFAWIKIAFPNIDENNMFIIYNAIKQREELVFPDNRHLKTFMIPRLNQKESNVILSKDQLISQFNDYKLNDTATEDDYLMFRSSIKNDLCVEIQLATYLAGQQDISILKTKIQNIGSKIIFSVLKDIKDYIRENIMTESVQSLTGVTLKWDDQNWESTLKNKSPEMALLFDSSVEAIQSDYEYRYNNVNAALDWYRWVVDNSTTENYKELQYVTGLSLDVARDIINTADGFNSNNEISLTACENIIEWDKNRVATTAVFQGEYLKEKINTFWIEYVYQLSRSNDLTTLRKISHT